MPLLGWVLLEHIVRADVWIRTTATAGAPPFPALVLLALVVALAIVLAHALQALLFALLPIAVRSDGPNPDSHGGRGSLSPAWSAPAGGMGPRAPGGRLRRLGSPRTL